MVKITNGRKTIIVTTGAYKEMYAPQGYKIVAESKETTFTEEIPSFKENVSKNRENEPSREGISKEPTQFSEQVMKPLSEMSLKELKKFARERNIDISSAENKQDMRIIISTKMED